MDLLAHAVAERAVDELVLLHAASCPRNSGADDHRLEVMPVALDLHVVAGETLLDIMS